MIILRESSYVAVPWKNGGGVTREILRSPPQPAAFDWRLSLATVASPGPFSAFDGYRRTLVLVSGAGIELNFAQQGRSTLRSPGQAVSFDGAWQTSCTLLDGPSTDLNLIVCAQRIQAVSSVVQLSAAEVIQTAACCRVLLCCIAGQIQLTNSGGAVETLSAVDVACCSADDAAITCSPHGELPPILFVASLSRRGP